MATRNYKATNGVSFGAVYTVVAQDATDNQILFDFGVRYPLAATITLTASDGTLVALTNAKITYPANGQVLFEEGTNALAAGQILTIVAQRASTVQS